MPLKRSQKKGKLSAKAKAVPPAAASPVPNKDTEEVAKPSSGTDPEIGNKRSEPAVLFISDLQATFQRRQKLAEELQTVEKQIYDLETRYLENSHPLGNALKGYEGLLTQSQASTRRTLVRQEDRLFSNSSATGAPH